MKAPLGMKPIIRKDIDGVRCIQWLWRCMCISIQSIQWLWRCMCILVHLTLKVYTDVHVYLSTRGGVPEANLGHAVRILIDTYKTTTVLFYLHLKHKSQAESMKAGSLFHKRKKPKDYRMCKEMLFKPGCFHQGSCL